MSFFFTLILHTTQSNENFNERLTRRKLFSFSNTTKTYTKKKLETIFFGRRKENNTRHRTGNLAILTAGAGAASRGATATCDELLSSRVIFPILDKEHFYSYLETLESNFEMRTPNLTSPPSDVAERGTPSLTFRFPLSKGI